MGTLLCVETFLCLNGFSELVHLFSLLNKLFEFLTLVVYFFFSTFGILPLSAFLAMEFAFHPCYRFSAELSADMLH